MDREINVREELLKIEKENEEKLKKEGYKQISQGIGYCVYSNVKKPSFFVSSFNNPQNSFNLENAQTVNTNFTIDRHIKMKNPPDPLVFIKMPESKLVHSTIKLKIKVAGVDLNFPVTCSVVPCAGFMRYIKSYPIVGTVEQTLEKKKGFTSRFAVSTEVKASVSTGFFGCEASLEVSTGFEYEETVTSETTQTWKQTLTEGTYIVYQNVLVYAYILYITPELMDDFNRYNPGVDIKFMKSLNMFVMFVPINRDDPFTLRYQDSVWDPIEYDTLVSYLAENPSKWIP
ncbi:hypothetical protein RB653_006615 [Dictyostelium firmibasis]|uniref:Monalysin Pore-forming domain-containing protein n=1 Tax=Dictyostelium firmibasis TaxID=79012 RepID=A0AAN7YTW6_9MYCE